MRAARALLAVAGVLAIGCSNAGEGRLLSISTTGIVKGLIYFDADGNRAPNAGDDSVKDLRVKLVAKYSGDSVASAVSANSGIYRIANVPVGVYLVVVDTTPLADTAIVAKLDSVEVTVKPGDSTFVNIGISYPHVTVRQARTSVALGHKVFIDGVALNNQTTYRDTTVSVQDTSAAIRVARILTNGVAKADSVRVRGTVVNTRPGGQRTLDIATVFTIKAFAVVPTVPLVTSAQAVTAVNGSRDAQVLQVQLATITDTATVSGDYRVTVNDGSGSVEVLFDGTAFGPPIVPGQLIPGNKFDIVGEVVPTGTAGIWRLKPRDFGDLVKH